MGGVPNNTQAKVAMPKKLKTSRKRMGPLRLRLHFDDGTSVPQDFVEIEWQLLQQSVRLVGSDESHLRMMGERQLRCAAERLAKEREAAIKRKIAAALAEQAKRAKTNKHLEDLEAGTRPEVGKRRRRQLEKKK